MGIFDFFKDTIGVDPGSNELRIIKGGELVFNEQSQISIDKVDNVISGFGDSIRTTAKDVMIRPVNYVIADFQAFEMFLRSAIKKGVNSKSIIPRSYLMFYVIPTGITEIEKRAYRDSAEHAGAMEVHMIYQSICAAIAMNLLVEKKHFILIDFSSSKIEMTIFANGLIISDGVIRMGTGKIVRLIRNHLKRKYKIEIEVKEIENLLHEMARLEANHDINIQHVTITIKEIKELLSNLFNLVNDEFLESIERVSNHPEIGNVIINGVYFTGGGSKFDFLIRQIKLDDRIKQTISQNPILDSVNGLKIVMADKEKYKDYLLT